MQDAASRALRVPVAALAKGARVLPRDSSLYIARVHRLRAGDRILAFDPEQATEAEGRVLSVDEHGVQVELSTVRAASAVSTARVTLLQAVAKGDKLDRIVRDATALGVTRIIPVQAERSVPSYGERASARRQRWRAIAVQAARQCGRGDIPVLDEVGPLSAALRALPVCRALCLHAASQVGLGEALADWVGQGPLVAAIGPEGGWSSVELDLMAGSGFTAVSLGDFVLRTETAATAALGAICAWLPACRGP
ncbi:MAG: 16S rRNA (uracil(1498)-N(3))-methyltransferase [Polyangiaceae bacterium]|nr:16S rRNA (uracil(1498)-N(3))-methyltransferase [Polyangiaceae bacterium]